MLTQEKSEINSHFKMRLSVYERAVAQGVDQERAALLATIFKNCYFIGSGYNADIVRESQQFWDEAWIVHYNEIKAE